MKTKNVFWGMICLMGILLVSCEDTNSVDQKNLYFPLAVGNTWQYGASTWKIENMYSIVYNDTSYQTYCLGMYTDEVLENNAKYLFSYDAVGNIYSYGGFSPVDTLYFHNMYINDTCKIGHKWTCFVAYANEGDVKSALVNMTCTVADTLISTAIGDFHCKGFRYDYNNESYKISNFLYFSKGVGMIESITKINGIATKTLKITEYNVK